MNAFPFDTVLFDLDGTLVDSSLDLAPAINHALALAGRAPVSMAVARSCIGGGTVQMLHRALEATGGPLDEARFATLADDMLAFYWAHIADNTVPFAGVAAALDELAAHGCKLAVCTNKLEAPARQLLDALGLTGHFTAIYGGDTLGPGRAKPAPDMLLAALADCGGSRAAMVGDTTFDARAARAAQMPCVIFTGGYLDAPLEEIGGDAVLEGFAALPQVLLSLPAAHQKNA